MSYEAEPLQQPIRKAVGRPPTPSQRLVRVENLLAFFRPNLPYLESGGVRIAYLSPADLIFLKQGSWREKDQLDVSAMKEILAREAKKT